MKDIKTGDKMIIKTNKDASVLPEDKLLAVSLNGKIEEINKEQDTEYFNNNYMILFSANNMCFVKYKEKSVKLTQCCALFSFFKRCDDIETALYFLNLVD